MSIAHCELAVKINRKGIINSLRVIHENWLKFYKTISDMFKYLNKCGADLLIPSSMFQQWSSILRHQGSPGLSESVFAARRYLSCHHSRGTKVSGSVFCLSSHQTNESSKEAVNSQHITHALNLEIIRTFRSFIY